MQIHSPNGSYGVDALKIKDIKQLDSLFGNRSCIKIIHSCRQDIEALGRRMDARIENLFDTQIAAGFCGYTGQISYARLVNDFCGVKLDKTQTRTDWSRRPLTDKQVEYALEDVLYLDTIRLELTHRLEERQRMDWFKEECEQVAARRDFDIQPDQAWTRVKRRGEIPPVHQNTACELAAWREELARKINLPREWVLSSEAMVALCLRRPVDISELKRIDALSKRFIDRSGKAVLALLERFPPEDRDTPVWGTSYDPQSDFPVRIKAAMARLREISHDEQISAELLANRRDIELLLQGKRDLQVLTGWRYDLLGRELIESFA